MSYKNQADRCRSLAVGLLFMYGCECAGFAQDVFTGENGKPQLAQANAYFNLSHAGDYAVAAFSDRPVGIDVECCGRFYKASQRENPGDNDDQADIIRIADDRKTAINRMRRIAHKILTPQEMENWESISSDDIRSRESALIRIWTRKEAFAKKEGRGLALDFSLIDTSDEARFLSWHLTDECWISVAFSD